MLSGFACAAQVPARRPLFEGSSLPEARPLPPDPRQASLEGFPGAEDGVQPLEKGQEAPEAGILSSERRFARDQAFRAAYPELRELLASRQLEVAAQRAVYEAELARLEDRVRELRPNWLERHQGAIMFCAGLVVGAWATVQVAEAVDGALGTKP